MFVHEDDIPDTVKHWSSFSDELMKEAKAAAPKGVEPAPPTTLTAIVMDSKALSPAEVRARALQNRQFLWQKECSRSCLQLVDRHSWLAGKRLIL